MMRGNGRRFSLTSCLYFSACQPNPCLNGGTCKIDDDDPKGYRCVCALKYAGLNCGSKINASMKLKCHLANVA